MRFKVVAYASFPSKYMRPIKLHATMARKSAHTIEYPIHMSFVGMNNTNTRDRGARSVENQAMFIRMM